MQATHAKGHADAAQAEIEVHTRKHADASLKPQAVETPASHRGPPSKEFKVWESM
jgi:hypothetical protein